MSDPESLDLEGMWRGEVRFTAGPLAGDVHHEAWLLAADGILVHLRTRRGVGEWSSDGRSLGFAFYEVMLNDAGRPTGVVHITSRGTFAPDRRTFEAVGRGDIYGPAEQLVGTNHTVARGWRAEDSARR